MRDQWQLDGAWMLGRPMSVLIADSLGSLVVEIDPVDQSVEVVHPPVALVECLIPLPSVVLGARALVWT